MFVVTSHWDFKDCCCTAKTNMRPHGRLKKRIIKHTGQGPGDFKVQFVGVPSGDQRREVMFWGHGAKMRAQVCGTQASTFLVTRHPPSSTEHAFWLGQGRGKRQGSRKRLEGLSGYSRDRQCCGEGHKGVSAFSHFPDELKSRDLGFQRGSCLAMAPIPRSHSDGKSDSQRPPDPLCGFFQEPFV